MTKLANGIFAGEFTTDLSKSFGPFVSIQHDSYLFDTRRREFPLWLGYNSSPLFGIAQHLESWTGEWTNEFEPIKQAYISLLRRVKHTPCGQINFRAFESRGEPGLHGSKRLTPAGLLYQYICLSVIEQFAKEHESISREIENRFKALVDGYGHLMHYYYANPANFEFGFEFRDQQDAMQFAQAATQAGILTKPCLRHSRRFQIYLNMSYRKEELALFWERLEMLLRDFRKEAVEFPQVDLSHLQKDNEADYEFHELMMRAKLKGKLPETGVVEPFLESRLQAFAPYKFDILILDSASYRQHREKILAMQKVVYESARQTPPEDFDLLFASENPLSILVFESNQIAAMVFAGRLGLFTKVRGVSEDPFVNDPNVYYGMDLTIASEFRGGLGRIMKQAMSLLAIQNGVTALHGRNRDRLARSMWAINLSLGSFELQRLVDDYPDARPHRDCIYYRCPLAWSGVTLPEIGLVTDRLRPMVNGLILKNKTL